MSLLDRMKGWWATKAERETTIALPGDSRASGLDGHQQREQQVTRATNKEVLEALRIAREREAREPQSLMERTMAKQGDRTRDREERDFQRHVDRTEGITHDDERRR